MAVIMSRATGISLLLTNTEAFHLQTQADHVRHGDLLSPGARAEVRRMFSRLAGPLRDVRVGTTSRAEVDLLEEDIFEWARS